MRLHLALPLVVLVLSLVFAHHVSTTAVLETRITTVIVSVAHTLKKSVDALETRNSPRQVKKPLRKDDTIAAMTRSGNGALRKRQGLGSQAAISLLQNSTWHNHLAKETVSDTGVSKEEVVTPSSWFSIVTTPASATPSSPTHDSQYCFNKDDSCLDMFHGIQQNFTSFDPDAPLTEQDEAFQRGFCDQWHEPFMSSEIGSCKRCFEQANLEDETWTPLEDTIYLFCSTDKPSTFLLLSAIVGFLNSVHPPSDFSTVVGSNIYNDVSILSTMFISTPGLMEPTSWPSPSLSTTAQVTTKTILPADCVMDDAQTGGGCSMVFEDIQRQIDSLPGQKIDPQNPDQSGLYQQGLCDLQKHRFRDEGALIGCMRCFDQAGTDATSFGFQLYDFCDSREPSVTLLIINIITFLVEIRVPTEFTIISSDIWDVTSYRSLFQNTTEWNSPASWPPFTTAVPHPRPTSVSTVTGTQPTDLLYQLPTSWPFIVPGVVRKPGNTFTWTLTKPFVTTTPVSSVAFVVASMPWYPRALGPSDVLSNYTMSVFVNASISEPPWMTPTMTCSGCGPILTEVPSGAPTISQASMGQ